MERTQSQPNDQQYGSTEEFEDKTHSQLDLLDKTTSPVGHEETDQPPELLKAINSTPSRFLSAELNDLLNLYETLYKSAKQTANNVSSRSTSATLSTVTLSPNSIDPSIPSSDPWDSSPELSESDQESITHGPRNNSDYDGENVEYD